MLKHSIFTLMACWLCWGVIFLIQAYEYDSKFKKSSDWSTTSGRIVEKGTDNVFPRSRAGRSLNWLRLLFSRPYIQYSYVINGEKYESVDKLPIILSPVRTLTMIMHRGDAKDGKNKWDMGAGGIGRQSKSTTTITSRDGTKIEKTTIKMGNSVVTEIRTTKPGGATIVKRKTTNPDGTTSESNSLNSPSSQESLQDPGLEIPVKYRPSDPANSVPGKDMIGGFETLISCAIVSILFPLIVLGAMRMHENVTNTDDDYLNQYDLPGSTRR